MGSSIELTEKKWISQRDFTQLPAKLDIRDIEAEVYFAHQLKGLLAKMPDSVFIDMTSRENLLDAATTYVHDTVDKEEE
jgi:type III secretion system TyeA family effector delivery regulator